MSLYPVPEEEVVMIDQDRLTSSGKPSTPTSAGTSSGTSSDTSLSTSDVDYAEGIDPGQGKESMGTEGISLPLRKLRFALVVIRLYEAHLLVV
jgi:hypothetical protein